MSCSHHASESPCPYCWPIIRRMEQEPCSVCGRPTGGCCTVMTTPEAGRCPECEMTVGHLGDCLVPYKATITTQAETIRRLEGEVARLTIAADECLAYELYTTVRQRAEAAEAELAHWRREHDEKE